MTQNEVNIIKNSVLDATEAYVDARLSVADFVKTQIGVTQGTPTYRGGKYYHTVLCNATSGTSGITYNNVLSVGNIEFPNNSVVFIIAPNAQFTNQFILGKLDDTPCNIVGGSIKIGRIGNTNQYYFTVDNTGNLNINNKFKVDNTGGLFIGGVDAATANFYVTNTGQVTMKSGSINIKDKFYVDSDGNLFVGGIDDSAPFYVLKSGYLHSTSGSIGGFAIGANALTVGDAKLSKNVIGCGSAGDGIVNLVGGNNDAYIQISDDGDPTTNTSGIRIHQNGRVESTLGTGWTTKYFKNIPDQEIYADSDGFLHFSA